MENIQIGRDNMTHGELEMFLEGYNLGISAFSNMLLDYRNSLGFITNLHEPEIVNFAEQLRNEFEKENNEED